jgi:hypothetical protein
MIAKTLTLRATSRPFSFPEGNLLFGVEAAFNPPLRNAETTGL